MSSLFIPDWRTSFDRALDDDPSNQAIRRDYADHLEEAGFYSESEAYRWLADYDRFPHLLTPSEVLFEGYDGWVWKPTEYWKLSQGKFSNWIRYCHIPLTLHLAVLDGLFMPYPTRREAETRFYRAYVRAKGKGWNPRS